MYHIDRILCPGFPVHAIFLRAGRQRSRRKIVLEILIKKELLSEKTRDIVMIDDVSMNILAILQEKARVPNVEVARQVGMAPSAVLERIRKMERQGIIDGYEVRLNPARFHRSQVAFVEVGLVAGTPSQAAGQALAAMQEVQEIHLVAGHDCLLVKVRVADTRELGEFLQGRVLSLEGVQSTRTATVLSTIKETAQIPLG